MPVLGVTMPVTLAFASISCRSEKAVSTETLPETIDAETMAETF
jgi:hypothetical protein